MDDEEVETLNLTFEQRVLLMTPDELISRMVHAFANAEEHRRRAERDFAGEEMEHYSVMRAELLRRTS